VIVAPPFVDLVLNPTTTFDTYHPFVPKVPLAIFNEQLGVELTGVPL
jgi:hypothetical protein